MLTRRNLFSFGSIASAAVLAPLTASKLLDPGRRVTYLPNGGTMIEDEIFGATAQFLNCTNMFVTNCIFNASESAPLLAAFPRRDPCDRDEDSDSF